MCRSNVTVLAGLQDLVRCAGGDHQGQQASDPEQGRANTSDQLLHVSLSFGIEIHVPTAC